MRHCSFFGLLLAVFIGAPILWREIHPDFQVLDWFWLYWPFLLIGWGLIRLAEVLVFEDAAKEIQK